MQRAINHRLNHSVDLHAANRGDQFVTPDYLKRKKVRKANADLHQEVGQVKDEALSKQAQIRKLEIEYLKLQKRMEEASDPRYIAELQTQLVIQEQDQKDKLKRIRKLEHEQRHLDRKISKNHEKAYRLVGTMKAGKVVDAVVAEASNVKADIEVCAMKIDQ